MEFIKISKAEWEFLLERVRRLEKDYEILETYFSVLDDVENRIDQLHHIFLAHRDRGDIHG